MIEFPQESCQSAAQGGGGASRELSIGKAR